MNLGLGTIWERPFCYTLLMGKKQTDTYQVQSYLIRLWQDGENAPWRASATEVGTGQQHLFVSPEQLFSYLHKQTQQQGDLS